MAYTKVNYEDVEPVADAMHFMRDPLDCANLGLTVVECEPHWEGKPHDHAENDHEEIYVLLEGRANVVVDGEEVSMSEGDALRIDPESQRQIQNRGVQSTFVLVGAP